MNLHLVANQMMTPMWKSSRGGGLAHFCCTFIAGGGATNETWIPYMHTQTNAYFRLAFP